MIVRALDSLHDWTYGKGRNDYLSYNAAISQCIDTALSAFLGDCFFDQGSGIDWLNLLGAKDETAISLSVGAVILNTPGVTGLIQLSITLNVQRRLTIQYEVQTIYSTASRVFQFDLNPIG